MQEAAAARPGTMAAVLGLDDEAAERACHQAGDEVWVANHNAPGQVVISGSVDAVAAATTEALAAGARRVLPIPVSGAFHTPFMAPAREALEAALRATTMRAPRVTVVANVDADAHQEPEEWLELLVRQLCSPVRWRHTVQRLADDGAATFVEVGPGGVLSGLAKRTVRGAGTASVTSPEEVEGLAASLPPVHPHPPTSPEGEHLHMAERLVVSPAAGVFQPSERWRENLTGSRVEVGEVLGTVGDAEIRSRFAGVVMGIIAHDGEQVLPSQPIAWLRTA